MKLIIGNKAYSSWSMRGWLAVKHSGLPFEEIVVPLYDEEWDRRRQGDEFAPSSGKVPILWDGDAVVWDSLAIIDYLADQVGAERFWPQPAAARGMARSMAAEMHSSFSNLRRQYSMNIRKRYPPTMLAPEVQAEVVRILSLWAEARSRFGSSGEYLFGEFGAADIMFAPVVTRFTTYSIPLPRFAQRYAEAIYAHPLVHDWIAEAQAEPWIIERFETPVV